MDLDLGTAGTILDVLSVFGSNVLYHERRLHVVLGS